MTSAPSLLYGIIGYPVKHTRSPLMHNAAFKALNISAVYLPFEVRPEALKDAIKGLVALNVSGVNVTVPHKTQVLSLLDDVDPVARRIGAVNTIRFAEGWSCGWNTDAQGFVRAMNEEKITTKGKHIAILGAGGAARAIVAGVIESGARQVDVLARRPEQAAQLIADLSTLGQTALKVGTWLEAKALADADIIIQSTSATLDNTADAKKIAETFPWSGVRKEATICDIVYQSEPTSFIAQAKRHGLRAIDGRGMLLQQGVLAFELWTAKKAPVDVMRQALE